MRDIEQISTIKPGDPELLSVCGLARETTENYIAGGRAFAARNDSAHPEADFRRTME